MELFESVSSLEREAQELTERYARIEREVRAPADAATAEVATVEAAVAAEEARLAAFDAELAAPAPRAVLTWGRSVLGAASLGAFTWGAAAADIDVPHAGVALFGAGVVAVLLGALRGR